jgi:hypothetical protein
MSKKTIRLDLPMHIGCFVYQYAKLRMLEFYYDFMDVFVDRSDFQYCSMDTDSAYMALSATSLEEVIKPDMQQRLQMEKKNWFPRDDTPEQAAYVTLVIWLVLLLIPLQLNLSSFPKQ